ncbi:Membrane protease subunit [Sesbania bispinosa]|nr:Membrane protease subunit [Sesbania bispinosa]
MIPHHYSPNLSHLALFLFPLFSTVDHLTIHLPEGEITAAVVAADGDGAREARSGRNGWAPNLGIARWLLGAVYCTMRQAYGLEVVQPAMVMAEYGRSCCSFHAIVSISMPTPTTQSRVVEEGAKQIKNGMAPPGGGR